MALDTFKTLCPIRTLRRVTIPYFLRVIVTREGHSYRNYWFEIGNPSYLVKLFQRERYFLPELEELEVTEEILASFDVGRIDPVTLLFQAGYLAVKGTRTHMMRQTCPLGVPNQEVRIALND